MADWLKIANVTNTTPAQLRAQLMTGRDVPLGAGGSCGVKSETKMKAIDVFQNEYPFPADGDDEEKDEWYTELGGFQLGWNAHAKEADTEEQILEKRLQLARELISALTNNGLLSPRLMTPETKTLWERWQAEDAQP